MVQEWHRGGASLPLVSVVVPCLNGARFLREALDSILAQHWQNWEVLVVDDGSTDGSDLIASDYAQREPTRIRLLRHAGRANRGISASRNLGIHHARGDLVAFLDADDRWESDKLSRHVPLLQAHPEAVMLYGSTLYWHSWTGRNEDIPQDRPTTLGVPPGLIRDPVRILERCLAGDAELPCTCSVLIRADALRAVGGLEESFTGWFEDQVLLTKLFVAGPIVVAPGCLDWYRQHPESLSGATAGSRAFAEARTSYLAWASKYLTRKGYAASRAWQLIRNERWRMRFPRLTRTAERLVRRLRRERARLLSRFRASRRQVGAARPLDAGPPPPRGTVRFGDLRRLTPISRHWGWDRGTPVDRFYIEHFMADRAVLVRGSVLEPGDRSYTLRFGADRVTQSDVLHVDPDAPGATLVADLANAPHLPSEQFDCILLPQTLHFVYELRAAMATLYRILRPGGSLLLTVPGISQTTDDEWRETWHWSLTRNSLHRLALEFFPKDHVEVTVYGNVLAAVTFLHGLSADELRKDELLTVDEDYPVTIALRATRPAGYPPSESA